MSPTAETKLVAFTAIPRVSHDCSYIWLENIDYNSESANFSTEVTKALLDRTSELLNFQNFELPGMNLKLKQIKVETGKMTLIGNAAIEQFPSN
ncbi:hypothetical protein [Merismopedia glauca]|uniref:DUF2993 domain-containing protein n=1 Tax=Merismopedia glauca CCAP 1448/3 TaxID=1296344 RepID=A0A2T1C3T0_9CYAN|nr:hypothetical protein [Merismopedia glauca]PSB02932.1 hypothetical protein C7B64_10825 [Merismopedia glauca CCAP 1448/3]